MIGFLPDFYIIHLLRLITSRIDVNSVDPKALLVINNLAIVFHLDFYGCLEALVHQMKRYLDMSFRNIIKFLL